MTDFEDELYRQLTDLHKLRSNVIYKGGQRYSTGHGVFPVPDKFWDKARYVQITIRDDGMCACTGVNTPLAPLGLQNYMPQEKLPKWTKDKIMKLQMMETGHAPIAGIGRRQSDNLFWVLAPYKYLPRERWRR